MIVIGANLFKLFFILIAQSRRVEMTENEKKTLRLCDFARLILAQNLAWTTFLQ
jgi:hypothetical protein